MKSSLLLFLENVIAGPLVSTVPRAFRRPLAVDAARRVAPSDLLMGVCFSACFGAEKGGDKGGPVQVQANVATSPGRWDFEAANGAGDKNKGMDGVPEATVRERAKAAVLGGLVADAATMGLHWCGRPHQAPSFSWTAL